MSNTRNTNNCTVFWPDHMLGLGAYSSSSSDEEDNGDTNHQENVATNTKKESLTSSLLSLPEPQAEKPKKKKKKKKRFVLRFKNQTTRTHFIVLIASHSKNVSNMDLLGRKKRARGAKGRKWLVELVGGCCQETFAADVRTFAQMIIFEIENVLKCCT